MNTLAYALVGWLLILAAPMVAADPDAPPADSDSPCNVFEYWVEPQPGYRVDTDCLLHGG